MSKSITRPDALAAIDRLMLLFSIERFRFAVGERNAKEADEDLTTLVNYLERNK